MDLTALGGSGGGGTKWKNICEYEEAYMPTREVWIYAFFDDSTAPCGLALTTYEWRSHRITMRRLLRRQARPAAESASMC